MDNIIKNDNFTQTHNINKTKIISRNINTTNATNKID
jgi:hypothetical protein